MNHNLPVNDNGVIRFDHTVTNLGNGYNNASGMFRVSQPGYYVLFVNLLAFPHKNIEALLVKNGVAFMNIYAGSSDDAYGPGGNMAVVRLAQGDDVWVKVNANWHSPGNLLDGRFLHFQDFYRTRCE